MLLVLVSAAVSSDFDDELLALPGQIPSLLVGYYGDVPGIVVVVVVVVSTIKG